MPADNLHRGCYVHVCDIVNEISAVTYPQSGLFGTGTCSIKVLHLYYKYLLENTSELSGVLIPEAFFYFMISVPPCDISAKYL